MKAVIATILFLSYFSLSGQVLRPVTEADYKLWGKLETQQLSNHGGWVSYAVHYEFGVDTLFVKSTKSMKTFTFPDSSDGKFLDEQYFACLGKHGNLIVTNLKSGKQSHYYDVINYNIAMGGKLLVVFKKKELEKSELLLGEPDGKALQTIPDVTLFSLNPAQDMLICDSGGKLLLLDLKEENSIAELNATVNTYEAFAWQSNSASVAYISAGSPGEVGFYRLKEKINYKFDQSNYQNFPMDGKIYNASGTELKISEDGSCVFFGVKEKEPSADKSEVQLLNTADKMLHPMKSALKEWTARPKLAVWFPEGELFRMVTDAKFPYAELLPSQKYALVYNPVENEPQFDRDAPIDFYLQNIATGQQRLILSKFSSDYSKIGVSGAGKFIAYFDKGQWWVYEIKSDLHRDLTSITGKLFIDENYDRSGEKKVFSIAGWTADDKELLVCDNYDVWLLKTDGSSAMRITKGREERIVYRVVPNNIDTANSGVDNTINLNRDLLLSATSLNKSGYSTWNQQAGLNKIIYEEKRIDEIRASGNGKFIYTKQHYHSAPQLVMQGKSGKQKLIYQSNPQQK